ncbi:MAG: aldo/keto reductase [Alphaproteobacteria bacterium]|nr:MAG: aldo/keto reductase [Alphaproteobacteria bacterium]
MRYNKLGRTDIRVSNICLGTMTWGEQNSQAEAREQMDYAVDQGVNFFDTAELYPVPRKRETFGRTEEFMGNWFSARGGRDKIILGTKVVGRSDADWFRQHANITRLNRQQICEALDNSLRRLKTDYIDLYQLHWPDRPMNLFSGSRGYDHHDAADSIPLAETLEVLDDLVKEGKIRHVGLSNETAWGVMKCLHHGEQENLPRVQSIQNAYNLLNRLFEQDLAEVSLREQVSLLAYSPLGGGSLSGKYLDGQLPIGSRQQLFPGFADRYTKPGVEQAILKYRALAAENGLTLVQLALKFIDSRPFVTSSIIGATTMDQLRENIAAFEVTWNDELEQAVTEIHLENPDPAP